MTNLFLHKTFSVTSVTSKPWPTCTKAWNGWPAEQSQLLPTSLHLRVSAKKVTTAAGLQGQTGGFHLEHECVLVTNGACSRVSEPCGNFVHTTKLSHFENLGKNSSLLPTVEYEKPKWLMSHGFMINPRNTIPCKMKILSLKKKNKTNSFCLPSNNFS